MAFVDGYLLKFFSIEILPQEGSSILKYLVAVTDKLVAVSFLIGLLLCAVPVGEKKSRWILYISCFLGPASGLVLFLVKIFNPKKTNVAIIKFNRQIIVGIFVISLISMILMGIRYFIRKKSRFFHFSSIVSGGAVVALSLLYITPQVYQFSREFVYFGEDAISTAALLRAIGFFLGLIVCLLVLTSTYKVGCAIIKKKRTFFIMVGMFLYTLDYGIKATSALQRMRILPLYDFVFKIMIFGDAHYKALIYAMLTVGVAMLIYVIFQNRKVTGVFPNNAARRKERAKFRNRRRWGYCLLVQAGISIFILSVVHHYDTKEVELTPPQPYKIEENKIIIPLVDIDDGHLHRFSYKTPAGYDVRFIAVKKPNGTAYGLGLDACEICGIAGYFERGDDVVCKRCDVVMNKATIGFKGGCNPIPFPYVIEDAKVIIDTKDLEREEKRFK